MLIQPSPQRGTVRGGAFFFVFLLCALTSALYLPFIDNPPFFDDENFFKAPSGMLEQGFVFASRWLPYWSMGLTWRFLGDAPAAFRLGSLVLHLGSTITLFFFLRRLLGLAHEGWDPSLPAFGGALLFALHPIAVFASGYIIQRTILMATLFGLLTCWAWLRGSVESRAAWLYASAAFYLLAVYSKEHAITVAAGCVLLLAWLYRTRDGQSQPLARMTRHHLGALLLYAGIAASVVAAHFGYLAAPYEPSVSYLLVQLPFPEHLVYPYSVLTQTGLYFKYLVLWLVPNADWVSVDMREPIADGWWPHGIFIALMTAYLWISCRLLWKGGKAGLWGLVLLLPLTLFATEFSTVRIQEPFVLYRSYLWMPISFGLAFALFISRFGNPMAIGLTAFVALVFAAFSANQLHTFSHPLFIWDQAAKLTENSSNTLGLDRIYHNRGQAYYDLGMREQALNDYNKAIEYAPNLPYSYNNRGALYLDMQRYEEALADFNQAISISRSSNPLMGRGLVYLAIGKTNEARADFVKACQAGFRPACDQLRKR